MTGAAGLFETNAIAARARRRAAMTEFSEEDVAPIKIREVSRGSLAAMGQAKAIEHLDNKGVFFLTHTPPGSCETSVYAMVLPTSFDALFQVRDVLADRTQFTTVPCPQCKERGLPCGQRGTAPSGRVRARAGEALASAEPPQTEQSTERA